MDTSVQDRVEPVILDIAQKQKVLYCIPGWLKIEQIKLNLGKCTGRIETTTELRQDPIACVSFGPSLQDTWEKIKEFKYVITCSGAHKFLVEHSIIPTWHIDVDPREHKISLIGQPQKETEYLIASTCHPKLLDYLSGYNVKLWHIFDNEEEGSRVLPPNEWMITGGCSAGTRTLTIARFLGFTELHIFGMDGCYRNGESHAAEHPNSPPKNYVTNYNGVEYKTAPAMLEAARNTWHELDMMKDVTFKFYGEGLVQEMAKDYKRKEIKSDVFIGFSKPELISTDYRDLNRKMHRENLFYGVGGGKHAKTVVKLMDNLRKDTPWPRCLDYGCGKGYLGKELPFAIDEYDPAIPGKDEPPRPADLVCCLDVLEHIEPTHIDAVLMDLKRVTKKLLYAVINTGPAVKTLPDGRNTHVLQRDRHWWRGKLEDYFKLADNSIIEQHPILHVVASAK